MFRLVQIHLKEVTCAIEFKAEFLDLIYRQTDHLFIYDIQKIIDGYIRRGVREDELEYSLGYSANDSCEIIAEPRNGGENTRRQLKRANDEITTSKN